MAADLFSVGFLEIAVTYVLLCFAAAFFIWCLCVAAGRADDRAEEEMRRERLARVARDEIDSRGGFRAR
jgi:hypothetical protein